MQPFSIMLFATTGDPAGIRHLDKSNWSGYGVVFNRDLFHLLKQEPGFSQAGIFILVGNAAEETIYIGKADPVGDRLKPGPEGLYSKTKGMLKPVGHEWAMDGPQHSRRSLSDDNSP